MKKDKKIVIVITLLVSIIMTYGVFKIFVPKKENKEIIKEVKKDKTFAIMIQNGDTYKEYKSEDNKWPGNEYAFSKAECVDNAGNKIENAVTFANGKVTLKSKRTIYCTLYFNHKETIEILRENDLNSTLSVGEVGGMYRYQGTDDVPNWICFGTTENCGTNDNLIDKYMYRIIGITKDGKIKLIKETYIKENNNTYFTKNDKYSIDPTVPYYCDDGICPEWNNSRLFKRLNGISNGTITGNGLYSNKADTDIFIDSVQYDYLRSGDNNGGDTPSIWYNLIDESDWMYGDTNIMDDTRYNGNAMYAIETGQSETTHYVGTKENITEQTYTWANKITAKIGLQYIHDYLYATPGGNPMNIDTAKTAWIFFQKDGFNSNPTWELVLTNYGIYKDDNSDMRVLSFGSRDIFYVGSIGRNGNYALDNGSGVRPVFYLSSETKLKNNKGTKEEPFIIDI